MPAADWIHEIPEIAALDAGGQFVRIPPETDVPLTGRVQRIIDTAAFRRLTHISQLGLVALVYPAAHHKRFEHTLGVYRLALLFLRRLACDERFTATVQKHDAELLIAAALLHDLGHWPFCHLIEDMHLEGVPPHEAFAAEFLLQGPVAEALRVDWQIEPQELLSLLAEKSTDSARRILGSILSGPIDVDKMDYLFRDSLHAGVPYGRHFDQQRLIGSLCLNAAGNGLAITDKGKTAAELMVFARYVMFSEVYWHHTVRAATAMFQHAFYGLKPYLDLDRLFRLNEEEMIAALREAGALRAEGSLLEGLFGERRQIYKRLAQYSLFEQPELYERLARRPFPWLSKCGEKLSQLVAAALGRRAQTLDILFDAPPVHREVQFAVDIYFPKENRYRSLGDVSPVVRALAREQFDDYVKRVRIFCRPESAAALRALGNLPQLVGRAVDETDSAS